MAILKYKIEHCFVIIIIKKVKKARFPNLCEGDRIGKKKNSKGKKICLNKQKIIFAFFLLVK
jgi:hypothetical protein